MSGAEHYELMENPPKHHSFGSDTKLSDRCVTDGFTRGEHALERDGCCVEFSFRPSLTKLLQRVSELEGHHSEVDNVSGRIDNESENDNEDD